MRENVWIWNHYATNMFFDKAGRHFWFSEYLIKNKYKPTIFCASTNHFSDKSIDTKGEKYTADTVNDIPFVFLNAPDYKGNGKKRILNMLSFYKNLFPVAKKYAKLNGKPDVILASSVHPLTMVAGIKIAKKFGIPCICEVRDLWPESIFYYDKIKENSLLGKILVKGEHWIYKKADALIFTKEGDTDYIKEKKWDLEQGGDIDLQKAHYINNGVDIEAFNKNINENKLEDSDLESGKFNIVYVGAIRPVNNVGAILDVAKLLRDYTDISFLIYGDGSQKEMLENRVRDESISNVKIKGYVNKQFIPYILSKSSINLLNYSNTQYNWTRGNSSNKLFEYMASGKPIISTVKMGYSLIKKYQCGLESESVSPQELAKTILEIKSMPTEEYELLGENAKKGAENFDFKILTEKLIDVINNVV